MVVRIFSYQMGQTSLMLMSQSLTTNTVLHVLAQLPAANFCSKGLLCSDYTQSRKAVEYLKAAQAEAGFFEKPDGTCHVQFMSKPVNVELLQKDFLLSSSSPPPPLLNLKSNRVFHHITVNVFCSCFG